jgi:penicillin-binding protein 2
LSSPQIVSAILVEHGGHGGSAAAPLARELYKTYFGIKEPESTIIETNGQNLTDENQ